MDFAASAPPFPACDAAECRAFVDHIRSLVTAAWRSALLGEPGRSIGPWANAPSLAEAVGMAPADPRNALIWSEALAAASRSFPDGADAQAERADALRLLDAMLDDPLGSRFAPAWLLRTALSTEESIERSRTRAATARRLAPSGGAVVRWARLCEIASAVAAGDLDAAIDQATVAASVDGPDVVLDAVLLAVRALAGQLTEVRVRQAVRDAPEVAHVLAGLPGGRTLASAVAAAEQAARGDWLDRCRCELDRLDRFDAEGREMRLRFGASVPVSTAIRERVDPAELSVSELAALSTALEGEAASIAESLLGWIADEERRVTSERERLSRFLASLATDLRNWERQVAAIESEAASIGIALHDFGLYSPFQWKQRRRAAAFRAHHEECVTNRDQAKDLLATNERRIHVEIAALEARIASLEEARGRLLAGYSAVGASTSERSAASAPVL
ncbi:MAG: hypothetical protein ACKO5K_08560 [Armatimonadota bacterium]